MKEKDVAYQQYFSAKTSNSKKGRALVLTSFLLLGCLVPMIALAIPAEAEGAVPSSSGSHYAYWHFPTSGGQWANADPDDPADVGGDDYTITETSPSRWGMGFPIRVAGTDDIGLDAPLYFKENGILTGRAVITFSTSLGAEMPDSVRFWASVYDSNGDHKEGWNTEVSYDASGVYEFSFEINPGVALAGEGFNMGWNIPTDTGKTTYHLVTAGESYCILPLEDDTDGDGTVDSQDNDDDEDDLPDIWEDANGLDSKNASDANEDDDGDGLTNKDEYLYSTDPQLADTDGDGYNDREEVTAGTSPISDASFPKEEEASFLDENMSYIIVSILLVVAAVIAAIFLKKTK
ncbi:MAG: hypothetical protein KAT70_06685 [Thermoplasmata archaeon]|nr:hypothetical protein [Thermoplasmata archaeon]